MKPVDQQEKDSVAPGPIAWMAGHPVASNLLMMICLLGGLFIFTRTTQEVFPAFDMDTVSIDMVYPGASPEEVEQGIVLALEDAVRDIDGLDSITATAQEGYGSLRAEIINSNERMRVLQDVKTAVDRITTFPVDAEDLSVKINTHRRDVVTMALYGDVSERVLRRGGEYVRDILEQDSDIGAVTLSGVRDYEIHIEVSQENLRRYHISLPEIAKIIKRTAIELGGGALDTEQGEILVRMAEHRHTASQFRDIPVIVQDNGSQVLLGDIAVIKETFEDTHKYAAFNGHPAVQIDTSRIGSQTPTGVSEATKRLMQEMNEHLPEGLTLSVVNDHSEIFRQRAALLVRNGLWGLLLVVMLLALFLDLRLAFWVSMGIPISFAGAVLLFPVTGVTVNIISMFAFIISLGIVVDDAVVSGENIYRYRQMGYSPYRAAVLGAREIATPVTISILTNIVAFTPLMFVPGFMGKIFRIIPLVVCSAFLMSLIESLFILPAHLRFAKEEKMQGGLLKTFTHFQSRFNTRFERFVEKRHGALLKKVIQYRYLVFCLFFSFLVVVGGYVVSGRMGMTLFPHVESDFAYASVTLQVGTPMTRMQKVQERLVASAQYVVDENGGDLLSTGIYSEISENKVEVRAYLTETDIRSISTTAFTKKWRVKTGDIIGLETSSFLSNRDGPGFGAVLTVELSHHDTDVLDAAGKRLADALQAFPNTTDIDDGAARGKKQYDFKMTSLGYTLGLTAEDVARQVRAAFHGSVALKQQRGRHEIRVLVRLPLEQRSSDYDIKNMIIRTKEGADVMLRDVVDMQEGRAYTTISRRDGRRVIQVSADVDPPSQAGRIISVIKKEALPDLVKRYPGLQYSFEGKQAEMRDGMISIFWGLLAVIFVMYALLALQFRNYGQPFMILLAIPFGVVGAVVGHLIMGYSLSMMSLFGVLALAGVVVNDSLILIDFANRHRGSGMTMEEAVVKAGIVRFRPILLTTMTTFVGLAPMIFETSRQAKFLIPMAISLGFGVLFATSITLVLIPALYVIIADIKHFFTGTTHHEPDSEQEGSTGG